MASESLVLMPQFKINEKSDTLRTPISINKNDHSYIIQY